MNIHVPANQQSRTELEYLSSVKNHLITAQSSRAAIVITQDSLLGAYLMTKENLELSREDFFHFCMSINISYPDIKKRLKNIQKINPYTSRSLISILLPDSFDYKYENKAMDDEPVLVIKKGIIISGAFNKSTIGGGNNTIIQILLKNYGDQVACDFIDNIQFITNSYLIYRGFSIGMRDCLITGRDDIDSAINRSFLEAEMVEKTTFHPSIREARINAALSKARDVGMRLAKEKMNKDNNFVTVIRAGSKGDFFNIAQIGGLLGQQNIGGKRAEKMLNKGKRTLPHYDFEITDKKIEFESRGFICSSFMKGLNPREFWFHSASGREGVTDTAMKTAQTGYIQRKMIKVMEDLQVKYDGTVRTPNGSIVQTLYGEDGFDGCSILTNKNEIEFCDISRIADKLNNEAERE